MTDISALVPDFNTVASSTNAIVSGMKGLGIDSQPLQIAGASLQIFAGTMQAVATIRTFLEAKKLKDTAEAVALTSAMATNPLLWQNIAIAGTAAAVTGTTLYGLLRHFDVSGNLSNPSEAKMIGQLTGRL